VPENQTDIAVRVRELVAERLKVPADASGAAAVSDDASLIDLGLDSTAILSLVVGLEDAFDIEIADHEINPDNFGTVRGIGDFVARRLGTGQ
jgi:acyl carrier protein